MKTLLTIVGARPQMMKAAAFSRAVALNADELKQVLLHTGQHYSYDMSGRFQEELQLPPVDVQLTVEGGPAIRLGQMMKGVMDAILSYRPDAVVVFGDTDSTLAAALAASRLHVPVVHIEAGLRSFDKRMPEEHNRILTDHLSDVLFCPSESAVEQLADEGIETGKRYRLHVEHSGDLMLDTARLFGGIPKRRRDGKAEKVLLTLHRPSNVDNSTRLALWMERIGQLAQEKDLLVLFPVHPRTRKELIQLLGDSWQDQLMARNIEVHDPASYAQMIQWLQDVDEVWTDSGGLQKEAFFMHRPALVLRDSTEWKELLVGGYAQLCSEPTDLESARNALNQTGFDLNFDSPIYGNGEAGMAMVNSLIRWLSH